MTAQFSDPNDPETQHLALAFLEGFQREMRQKEEFLRLFGTEEGKSLVAKFSPALAQYYESKTKSNLEFEQMVAAIGVGVAAAIRYALASPPVPPSISEL